ncbi:hypothetical protein [Ornithinimicrobium cryptoxanthini]|uniref:hypothetical protein n=1 Tax=Ornithinimicrobium cryptoxanthini TaxID=2934161 RepID=UPI0021191973|nr:hypothetical protein [Ornithinimicrobium cryptoxanthini]
MHRSVSAADGWVQRAQSGDVISAALLVTAVTGVHLGILPQRPVRAGSGAKRGTMGPP